MRAPLLITATLLIPRFAAAADVPVYNVETVSCSGTLTSDVGDVMTLKCDGDFSLDGGTLSASTKIVVTASGSLSTDNLLISAPEIGLTAGSQLTIGSGTSFIASNAISLTTKGPGSDSNSGTCTGALSIGAGATITISSSNGITDSPPNQAIPLCNAIAASDPNAFTGGNITISPDPATSTPSVQVQPDPPASTPSEPMSTNSSTSTAGGAFSPWAMGTLLLGVLVRMRKGERQGIPVQPISGR